MKKKINILILLAIYLNLIFFIKFLSWIFGNYNDPDIEKYKLFILIIYLIAINLLRILIRNKENEVNDRFSIIFIISKYLHWVLSNTITILVIIILLFYFLLSDFRHYNP